MNLFRKNSSVYRWLLLLLFAAFAAARIQDFSLPYFWDEAGVYVSGSLHLYDNGLSLLPGSIPPGISRGHPLLFVFIVGAYYKVAGTSIIASHLFAFIVSLAFLGATYRLAEKFLSPVLALLSAGLLIVQPIIFAQSIFVLPEMMLGFFALLAIHAYLQGSFGYSVLWVSLALQTKETAIVLPLVFISCDLAFCFLGKVSVRKIFRNALFHLLPILTFLIFLVAQRIQNGWYFFPLHTDNISQNLGEVEYRLRVYLEFIFALQGRIFWLILFSVTPLVFNFRNRRRWSRILASDAQTTPSQELCLVLFIYILGILGYSMLNFVLQRYMILIYPAIVILLIVMLKYLFRKDVWVLAVTLCLCVVHVFEFWGDGKMISETDLSYRNAVYLHQNVALKVDQDSMKNKIIQCDFPMNYVISDPRMGYIKHMEYDVLSLDSQWRDIADYQIYNYPGSLEVRTIDSVNFEKCEALKVGQAYAYIYKRRNAKPKRQ